MDSQKKPAKKPKPPRMTQSEIDDLEFSEDKRLRRLGIDPDGDQVGIYRELKRRIAEQEIPLSSSFR